MTLNSEKITDHLLLTEWTKFFKEPYNTKGNIELFGTKIPDGWFVHNNNLIIIENKKSLADKQVGKKQLISYYNNIPEEKYNFNKSYLILGLGDNITNFNYIIFEVKNGKVVVTNLKISDLVKEEIKFNPALIHNLNQYLYDNGINLPKSQKTLFIASILLCLKINPKFIDDYDEKENSYLIADKMINTINEYYNDYIFTNMFHFIKKSLHNKHLFELFNKLEHIMKNYGSDILNRFYSEFCLWDRNNDSKFGVVLTPPDIVEMMVKELNISPDESVLDFCTGTGSFLIEAGKYTNKLIGCENNDERYSLAKCNMILNNLPYDKLYYNSCFNQNFDKADKVIINPPFSCVCSDEEVQENETKWKEYKAEQRFILYQIQCLKENGIGCCIVPRSNFNNSNKSIVEFKLQILKFCQILKIINCNSKVFSPNASVECTILIFKKIKEESKKVEIIDYSDDGFIIKKNVRIKIKEPKLIKQTHDLTENDDWNYIKEYDLPKDLNLIIKNYNTEYTNCRNKIKYISTFKPLPELKNMTKEFKLCDIFEILKLKSFITEKTNPGYIPLFGATQLNNPVKYINDYSIDTDESDDILIKRYGVFCINKTGDGGAGISFIRKGKFAINSTIMPLKSKIYISITNAGFISLQLHHIFNRSNNLNLTKFKETKIKLFDDEINLCEPFDKITVIPEDMKLKEWKKIRIGDYLDYINKYKTYQVQTSKSGIYPLITRSGLNNGITKFISNYSLDGEYFTIAPSGSVGFCFYHTGKFALDGIIKVFKLKEDKKINSHILSLIITYFLTQKYSYSNGLTIDKILNEEIFYPIFE